MKASVSGTAFSTREALKLSYDILSLSEADIIGLIDDLINLPLDPYSYTGANPLYSAFQRWGELNPKAAIDRVLTLNFMQQEAFVCAVFEEWIRVDSAVALGEIENLPAHLHQDVKQTVISVMAESDVEFAWQFALDSDMNDGLWDVVYKFAIQDPKKALEKVSELPPGWGDSWNLESYILDIWASQVPGEALAHVLSFDDEKRKTSCLVYLINSIGHTDSTKAFSLLNEHRSRFSEDDFSSMLWGLGKSEPQKALSWVRSNLEGKAQSRALDGVFRSWFSNDEEDALAWYQNLAEGDEKEALGVKVMDCLSYQNPKAFFDMYHQLDNKKAIDDWRVKSALTDLAEEDPSLAIEEAMRVGNAKLRSQSVASIMQKVAETDSEKAFELAEEITCLLYTSPSPRDA